MKEIRAYEDAARREDVTLQDLGINGTMYWAYHRSRENGSELLNFHEVIWDHDIPEIVKACREYGIERFTISSTFSGLLETLAAFEEAGFEVGRLTKVPANYRDFRTREYPMIPAITIIVK